jgi:hypothetical protein
MFRSLVASFCLILLFAPAQSFAADVKVNVTPQIADPNETFSFSVTVERQTGLNEEPQWASSSYFSILTIGRSNQAQYINGQVSARTTFNYELRPLTELTPGAYETPDGTITIDGKTIAIPKITIRIRKPSSGKKKSQAPQPVAFAQRVSNPNPYIGEQITYVADVAADSRFISGNLEDISYSGFWREELGDYSRSARKRGDLTIRSLKEVLIPTAAGDFTIPKRKLLAELATTSKRKRTSIFDRFAGFSPTHRTRRRQLFADEIKVSVKPLPPAPNPEQGYIPVGDVKVRTVIDKKEVVQGESVSMTITLWGKANLRPFKLPKSQIADNKEFKVYYDKAKSSLLAKDGFVLFSKVFRIAFVPQNFGTMQLPTFKFHSFDPKTGKYVTHQTDSYSLRVSKDSTFVKSASPKNPVQVDKEEQVTEEPTVDPIKDGDIFPPKSLEAMKESPLSLSPKGYLLSLFYMVLSVCLLFFYKLWSLRNVSLHRQRIADGALEVAKESLKDNSGDAAKTKEILCRFLFERFNINARSMTAGELRNACKDIADAELDDLVEIAHQLDRALYAPGESSPLPGQVNQQLLSLLSSLDSRNKKIISLADHE